MAACKPIDVDFASLACVDQCRNLFNAYMAAVSGRQRVTVHYDGYSVAYKASEVGALVTLYNTLRSQCPAAQTLPNLQAGARVMRGQPIFGDLRR